jgi:DNA mismatch endonuclease (patch repair protein)
MPDVFSKEKRSWIMSRIGGRNTKPEIAVRSAIHRMGYRFRLHRAGLPGKPDIVLPGSKKAIFVHGCFWHGHNKCMRGSRPATNKRFWNKKLDTNMERDVRFKRKLKRMGWEVLVVWECELNKPERLIERLKGFLNGA